MKPSELNLYNLSGTVKLQHNTKQGNWGPFLIFLVCGGPIVQYFLGLELNDPISLFLLAPAALLAGLSVILLASCIVGYTWSRWLRSKESL